MTWPAYPCPHEFLIERRLRGFRSCNFRQKGGERLDEIEEPYWNSSTSQLPPPTSKRALEAEDPRTATHFRVDAALRTCKTFQESQVEGIGSRGRVEESRMVRTQKKGAKVEILGGQIKN